jgi:gamma-glutamyltranspeptidase/glutathione hydrolase
VARAARQRLSLQQILLTGLALFGAAGNAAAASLPAVAAPYGMFVAEQRSAAQIGREILRAGGDAVDAAVAVGYALAVVYPAAAISAAAGS